MRKRSLPYRMTGIILAVWLLLAAIPVQGSAAAPGWDHIVDVLVGDGFTIGLRSDGRVMFAGEDDGYMNAEQTKDWTGIARLESTWFGIIGYRTDGTVVTTMEADVGDWKNVVKVVPSYGWVACLHGDGTVSAVPLEPDGDLEIDVTGWRDVRQLEAYFGGLIGLKTDGTLLETSPDWAYNWEEDGAREDIRMLLNQGHSLLGIKGDGSLLGAHTDGWNDVVYVCLAADSVYGLRSDGTVTAYIGYDLDSDRRIQEILRWKNIVQLSMDGDIRYVPAGLCADGTVKVVTKGWEGEPYGEWDTAASWTGVKKLFSAPDCLIGLKADGTLVFTGGEFDTRAGLSALSSWKNITEIYIGSDHIVGLRADGTLVAAGDNRSGQCRVS